MKWVYRLPYFHKSLQNSTSQQRRLEVGIESTHQWSDSWWKVISKLMEWHFPWELVWILWACSKISYWLLVYESRFFFFYSCVDTVICLVLFLFQFSLSQELLWANVMICRHILKFHLSYQYQKINPWCKLWGCWGWQAARTWVSVSPEMVGFLALIGLPGASQSTGAQKGTKGTWGKEEKPANA